MDNSQSDSSFSSGATFEDSPDSDPEFDPNLEWIETADVEKSFRIPKTNPYPSSKDVLQPDTIFSNFFDQKIMDMLVNYSNNYNHYLKAQENTLLRYPKTDKVVTEGTLRKYLAARILMVNAKIPNIKNYWTMTITKTTPNINSMLTWYKFQVLDEKLCIYDPLAPHNSKIDTFLKAFSENCRNNYRIGSNICLGRKSVVHKHKKLLRSKKWIFKLLILADSMTGYV